MINTSSTAHDLHLAEDRVTLPDGAERMGTWTDPADAARWDLYLLSQRWGGSRKGKFGLWYNLKLFRDPPSAKGKTAWALSYSPAEGRFSWTAPGKHPLQVERPALTRWIDGVCARLISQLTPPPFDEEELKRSASAKERARRDHAVQAGREARARPILWGLPGERMVLVAERSPWSVHVEVPSDESPAAGLRWVGAKVLLADGAKPPTARFNAKRSFVLGWSTRHDRISQTKDAALLTERAPVVLAWAVDALRARAAGNLPFPADDPRYTVPGEARRQWLEARRARASAPPSADPLDSLL